MSRACGQTEKFICTWFVRVVGGRAPVGGGRGEQAQSTAWLRATHYRLGDAASPAEAYVSVSRGAFVHPVGVRARAPLGEIPAMGATRNGSDRVSDERW